MKDNILLDVTIKAKMDSPLKLKGIQNVVAKFNESVQCYPKATYLLQMLRYMCLKVLVWHHASYTSSAHVEGFGMTVCVFLSFLQKHDDSENLHLIIPQSKKY